MNKVATSLVMAVGLATLSACRSASQAERFGKTFYLDGAGNWGWGTEAVTQGLYDAGYAGDVEVYVWTTSLNPLIDQWNILGAKLRAASLARRIEEYRAGFPHTRINIVALSAGTGVAAWAVEQLPRGVKVDNVVLLASSLSNDYDMSEALAHMTGSIYVYHSSRDDILKRVPIIGTIDGRRGVDAAGLVGLVKPPGLEDRIVNIPWSREWLRYGWTGGHVDCTNPTFVRYEVAPRLFGVPPVLERHAGADGPATSASGVPAGH